MSRSFPSLLKNVTAPSDIKWVPTDGYLNSIEATIDDGTVSATVEIYVSNSSHGTGIKIATLTLSASKVSDGFSLPKEDQGWAFVGAKVAAVNSGSVKSCTACIGE